MPDWIVIRLDDGHERIVASYPDEPPARRGNDRRDVFTKARHRLIEEASAEISSGAYALIDAAHAAAESPHGVTATVTATMAVVVVRCSLGCPERHTLMRVDRR